MKIKWNDVHPCIRNKKALYFHPLGDGGRKGKRRAAVQAAVGE